MQNTKTTKPEPTLEYVLKTLGDAIKSIEYGTIQITVHNKRVVQIDKVERIRLVHDIQGVQGEGI